MSMRAFLGYFTVIILFFSPPAQADFSQVIARINQAVRGSGVPISELGIWVGWADPAFRNAVYELHSDRLMIPASVTKLITAAAVLDKYDANRQFLTTLVLRSSPAGEIYNGDLYLIGGGDPTFTSEQMWVLVNDFQRSGIKKIEGDIVVDDSRFDQVRFDPGREPDRVDSPYDAPVGGMSFNWNTANIYVRPGEVGGPPMVIVDPDNRYVRVENRARTISGSSGDITVERLGVFVADNGEPEDVMRVSGTIGTQRTEIAAYKNISQPDIWSGYALKSFLSQRGIEVTGRVVAGTPPSRKVVIAKLAGQSMNKVAADMLKHSNNFIAEMLTKNLAADFKSQPAKMEDGIEVIKDFLKSIGFAEGQFEMVNPSGLTRRNKFRARDVGLLLTHLRSKYKNFPELLAAEPVAGVDGTLSNRMKGTSAEGWVRAKTGTLTGVAGLAGYAFRPRDGKAFEFAFFFNGSAGGLGSARRLFDNLAVTLVETPVGVADKSEAEKSVEPEKSKLKSESDSELLKMTENSR